MQLYIFWSVPPNVDKNNAIIVIFLDMTKAFDHKSNEWLLLKMRSLGLADPLYSWLTSYLSYCSQVVSINVTLYHSQPIASGVIQGNVLGPYWKRTKSFKQYAKAHIIRRRHHDSLFLRAISFNPMFANVLEDLNSLDVVQTMGDDIRCY